MEVPENAGSGRVAGSCNSSPGPVAQSGRPIKVRDPEPLLVLVTGLAGNCRLPGKSANRDRMKRTRDFVKAPPRPHQPSGLWLYGLHAVRAALANKKRRLHRVVLTERAAEEIGKGLLGRVRSEIANADAVSRLLPS